MTARRGKNIVKMPCPNTDQHTLQPDGYLAWFAWAEEKTKTHEQKQCPDCGLWEIWVPKTGGES